MSLRRAAWIINESEKLRETIRQPYNSTLIVYFVAYKQSVSKMDKSTVFVKIKD